MTRKMTAWLFGIVALFVIVLAAYLLFPEREPRAVRIGYLPITVDLPFFVALEKGYFSAEGLKVEPVRFESTSQLYDAMLAGRIDATAIGGLTALYGIEASHPGQFKIYALNANDALHYTDTLLVKAGSPIVRIEDLKGKRIGTFPGATIVVGTTLILGKHGLHKGDYDIIQMAPSLQLQALESGQIDALMALEPTGTLARLRGVGKIIETAPNAKYLISPFPGGAAAFKTSWADEHHSLALSITRATNRAVDFIRTNAAESRAVLPKYVPMDNDVASETLLCLFWKVEDADRRAVQDYADILRQEGVYQTAIDTSSFYFEP